jgi:hypothetical protein
LYETNPEGIEYYPSSITATDAQRLQTRAKEASLTYTNTCDLNGKIHFTANLIDQFNRSVENTSSTVWSVSGGGTIDQTGTFTSNKTPGGYTATATIGNLSANVTFEVKSAPGSTDAESGILKNQVCVDFGGWCANSAKESWNVLQGFVSGGILNMIDTNGDSTKISISVTKRFTAINWLGGGNTVAVNSWVFPHYSVTYDSFYGNTTTEGYSQLTISGLNSTQSYNFSFFGSCFGSAADQGTQTLVSDNRETSYTVKGETEGSASLAASNNLTQIAQIDNIKADANGNIIINIQKGSNNNTTNGTYFLNCMKLAPVSNTSGFKNNTLEQIAFFDFNNKKLHINDEVVSKSMIYNVNGMLVSTLNGAGVFDISNLRAGVYILKSIDRDDTQHIQRFILQ